MKHLETVPGADNIVPVLGDYELYPTYNNCFALVDASNPESLVRLASKPADYEANLVDNERWRALEQRRLAVDSETGTVFGYMQLNEGAPSRAILFAPWSVEAEQPLETSRQEHMYGYELVEIARRNADVEIVVVDHPTMGSSTGLPKEVLKDLAQNGEFGHYGAILQRAMAKTGLVFDQAWGLSMGGRAAWAYAGFDHNVKRVVDIDSPGSSEFGYLEFFDRFANEEAAVQSEYLDAQGEDRQFALAYRAAEGDPSPLAFVLDRYRRGQLRHLYAFAAAMRRQSLQSDIEDAMSGNPHLSGVRVAPTWSYLNPMHREGETGGMKTFVSAMNADELSGRVKVLYAPGGFHSMSTANSHNLGELFKYAADI